MSDLLNIETTLQFIRNNAPKLAKAKGDKVYLEQFRKSKKALLIIDGEKKGISTAQMRESYAYAHDEYIELLNGLQIATEEYEKLSIQIRSAELRIEVWRTQNANQRFEYQAYGNTQKQARV